MRSVVRSSELGNELERLRYVLMIFDASQTGQTMGNMLYVVDRQEQSLFTGNHKKKKNNLYV